METLNPSAYFLRVSDKFFGDFICRDAAVRPGPALLYLLLFRKAYKGGICRPPQLSLAKACKCSVRSIQHYLRALAALQYISIEQQEDGCNVYRLLLSPRALFFITEEDGADGIDQGEACSPDPAKNLRRGGEKSSPSLRDLRDQDPPLPPTASTRGLAPSARKASSGTTPVPGPQAGGRGDSFSGKRSSPFHTADSLFERFYAAYPRKEAKEPARAVWHQLWRRGDLPSPAMLLAALERFRATAAWNREHGRFVPYLVNWLRGKRWEDEADGPDASSGVRSMPETIERCMKRLEDQRRPDPALEAARPVFEAFLDRFADGRRMRGPAWGLWALLHRQGKAPDASRVSNCENVLAFLQSWQRGVHVKA